MNFKEILYKNLRTMPLEDYQKYLEEAKNKYISIKSHPEDENIIILNYTEITQFERRWNKETRTARGLILDVTNAKDNGLIYILAKPFNKFPNFGEDIEYEEDIDFTEQPTVMEKMDGSLGISYFFNNEIRFATRGSFTSEQAIKATEIWKQQYEINEDLVAYLHSPVTYLVEIIYPENRVVVDYKGKEELVLLGVTFLSTLNEASYSHIKKEAGWLNMPVVKQYNFDLETMLKMKESISANEEGWVVRFSNGKRLKIKGDEYLNVHRIKHGLSEKAKFKAWSEDKIIDYIKMLPEEFRPELEEFKKDLDSIYQILHNSLEIIYKAIEDVDRKQFALKVKQHVPKTYHRFMFEMFKTQQVPKIMIKNFIYENYKEYMEVITWCKKNNVL